MQDLFAEAPPAAATQTQPAAASTTQPTKADFDLYADVGEVAMDASVADMPPPRPDGWHLFTASLHPSTKNHFDKKLGREMPGEVTVLEGKNGKPSTVKLQLNILLTDENGKKTVHFADSMMRNGTSFLDDLLGAMDRKLPNRTLGELRDAVVANLQRNPQVAVRTEWLTMLVASKDEKNEPIKYRDRIVCRGMANHPTVGGKHQRLTAVPTGPRKGQPCETNSEVVQYAKAEVYHQWKAGQGAGAGAGAGSASAGAGAGVGAPVALPVVEDDVAF